MVCTVRDNLFRFAPTMLTFLLPWIEDTSDELRFSSSKFSLIGVRS